MTVFGVGARGLQTVEDAQDLIAELIQECKDGLSNREAEAMEAAQAWDLDEDWVMSNFAEARRVGRTAKQKSVKPNLSEVVKSSVASRKADKYIAKDGGPPPTSKEKSYEFYTVEADLAKAQERIAELETQLKKPEANSVPAAVAKVPKLVPEPDQTWLKSVGFEIDSRPPWKPAKTLANARRAVEMQGYVCSYNEFLGRFLVLDAKGIQRQLSDEMVITIRQSILDRYGFDPGKTNVYDAMESLCLDNRVNPVVEYLNSLDWDGVPRLDTWLIDFAGAEDTSLNRAFGRKSICALVRRAKQQGCKFDNVLTLEGLEDIGKSRLIKAIVGGPGPEYFSDETILDKPTRDQQELTKGRWGYELSELSGLRRAETEKVKGFLSRQQDEARPAYGRYRVEQPRSCVFFGTTNELDEYLMSQTGNRRWWPVRCETSSIDVEGFLEVREQIFAEAALAEPAEDLFIGTTLRMEVRALQESRRTKDAWEDTLITRLGSDAMEQRHLLRVRNGAVIGQPGWVSDEWRVHTNYIFEEILDLPKGSLNDAHTKRLPRIMRNLGWAKAEGNIRIGSLSRPGYILRILQISGESL